MALFRNDFPLTPSWDLIAPSVKLLRNNIWTAFYLLYLPALILSVGTVMLGNFAQTTTWGDRQYIGAVILIVGLIYSLISRPAATIFQLRAASGAEPGAIESLKAGARYILPMLGMNILVSLLMIGGFFLLIIPGLFVVRSYYLAPYYMVGYNLGALEAMKRCRQDSLRSAGYIWGVIGVGMLFSLATVIFQIIPLVGTMIAIAVALLYRFADTLRYKEIVTATQAGTKKPEGLLA